MDNKLLHIYEVREVNTKFKVLKKEGNQYLIDPGDLGIDPFSIRTNGEVPDRIVLEKGEC
jgi:hypothetical protein